MNDAPLTAALSRRQFLVGGGALIVSFSLMAPSLRAQENNRNAAAAPAKRPLPGSLKDEPMLDAWIRIDSAGNITVFTGKAELGQGIKTALIQIAAEELSVDISRIALITADTQLTPNEGYTAGSHSMQDSGTAIKHAAAQVGEILAGLAAQRFGVAADGLTMQNGAVCAADGRCAGYGELVGDQQLHVRARETSTLKDPRSYVTVGKSVPRVDIPRKVTGGASYLQDLRLPGMVHARVLRPPSPGARLVALDTTAANQLSGVIKIIRDGNFVAVVAAREFQAVTAMRALARAASWQERPTLPAQDDIYALILRSPAQDTAILDVHNPAPAAVRTLEATYRRPYQMHGSIGPACAVALYKDEGLTVWTHTQGVYPLRKAIAEMLRMPAEQVRCIHMEGAGCYGHNAADDAGGDAALIARALPDRPVRVQWMREDEHLWEPYGPAMVSKVAASLDSDGLISDWQYHVWSNTHSMRPGPAGNLLAAQQLATPFAPAPPMPIPQPEGGGDRNAIPLYKFRNARVVHHFVPGMPLRVSALRALGAYMNIFSIECFIDELAQAAGSDAVDFRLRHMEDARARDVMRAAAERFGWSAWQAQKGRGRGFAFARYKNLGAYAAVACEVEVEHESGRVRVMRAAAAVDSGQAVNPDGIRNQIEGGIVQSLSWSLYESVTFDATRITSRDWAHYPILRFSAVPERIEVHVIERPGQPFLGTGEAAHGPTAGALANAIADATGVRMRELPFTAKRVKAAIGV